VKESARKVTNEANENQRCGKDNDSRMITNIRTTNEDQIKSNHKQTNCTTSFRPPLSTYGAMMDCVGLYGLNASGTFTENPNTDPGKQHKTRKERAMIRLTGQLAKNLTGRTIQTNNTGDHNFMKTSSPYVFPSFFMILFPRYQRQATQLHQPPTTTT
jgi:hypothetical protein